MPGPRSPVGQRWLPGTTSRAATGSRGHHSTRPRWYR
jgi:hypothetical protein